MPQIVVSEMMHGKLVKMRNDRSLNSVEAVIAKLLDKNYAIDYILDELQFADDLLGAAFPSIKEKVAKDFAMLRMRIAEDARKVV